MSAPLYFGNELDAMVPSDNGVVETATQYNATYCRCSVKVPQGSSAKSVVFASQTAMWFHFDNYMDAFNGGVVPIFSVYDDVGTEVFRISATKFYPGLFNTTYIMQYLSAPATFTQIGGNAVTASSLQTIDLFVDKPNGIAKLYIAGSLQVSATAVMGSVTNFAQVGHLGGRDGDACYWSQMFGAVESTIGRRLKTLVEDTPSAVNVGWTGVVGNINELVLNDATNITGAVNGDVATYFKTGLTLSGTILGMGTSARFNVGGSGPANLQNVIRVSGANYNSASVAGSAGFAVAQKMWMTNPATATPWTPVTGAAIEWGVEAKT